MLRVEIRLKGYLDKYHLSRFSELSTLYNREGDTVLSGSLHDQAELRGLLNWLADLGIELISVNTSYGSVLEMKEKEVNDSHQKQK